MITSKGYKILLNHEKANEFRKELTIVPFLENSTKYPIYRISENYLYIPKYYGIKKLGLPEIIKEQEGEEVELNFSGKLRDYQQPIVDNIIKHLIKNQSGLASLYTGWGKTCAALYISSIIKRKTLIIVHTYNLLEQWKERIKEFLNEEIGIIKGPIIDIKNKKVVVGMIQSISQKDYEKDTFKNFGLTIYDECHHTPGKCFSKIFYKIGTKYNLGLSATLIRKDGLTKVIKYFIGDPIVNLKLTILKPTINFYYTSIEPIKEKKMINGKPNIPGMLNDLIDSNLRNIELVNIIKERYNENRKILVLTSMRRHCFELKRLLSLDDSVGIYIGGKKNEELNEANTKSIIIATYQMASEGYDNKTLDTLILATPKTDVEQAVGRILRQENINNPIVIDIVDQFHIFNAYYYKRRKFYKTKKFVIENDIDNNEEIKFDTCTIID